MSGYLSKKLLHNIVVAFVVFIFFIMPRFSGGVRLEEIIVVLYTIFLLPYFVIFCFKNNILPVVFYFLFLVVSFILCLYSDVIYIDIGYFNWIYFFKYFLFFSCMCFGFYSGKYESFNNKYIKKVIYISLGLNFIWIIYQIISGNFGSLFGADKAFSYGLAMIGEAAAFQVGSILSLIFFLGLVFFYERKNNFLNFIGFIFILFILYLIFLTQSRVSLVSVLIGIFIYFVFRVSLLYKYLAISISLIVVIYLFNLIIKTIQGVDNNRFTYEGVMASYQARGNEIWLEPLDIVMQNIFTGHGLGALSSLNKDTNEMHNYYLKLALEGGVLYLVVFVLFILSVLVLKSKYNKYIIAMKLYLLGLIVSGFLQDSFSSNKAVIPLFFILGYFLYTINLKGVNRNG